MRISCRYLTFLTLQKRIFINVASYFLRFFQINFDRVTFEIPVHNQSHTQQVVQTHQYLLPHPNCRPMPG
jgi:hypothetical protein